MRGPLSFCRAGAAGVVGEARRGGGCGAHHAPAAVLLKLMHGDHEQSEGAESDGLLLSCCCSWGAKRSMVKTRTLGLQCCYT